MADDINRQHIYNIMDWLEEEQEKKNGQSRVSTLAGELAILHPLHKVSVKNNEYFLTERKNRKPKAVLSLMGKY